MIGAWNFSSHRVSTGSGAHPAYYSMGTRGSFPGSKAAQGEKLTIHLNLRPRSRMRGTIPSLPQHAFVAQLKAQGQLYLYLTNTKNKNKNTN